MKNGTNLASFLKEARAMSGLSQRDVSVHLGYDTPQFISNWERGVSSPPVSIVKKLAELYRVSADDLFEVLLQEELRITTQNLQKRFKQSSAR